MKNLIVVLLFFVASCNQNHTSKTITDSAKQEATIAPTPTAKESTPESPSDENKTPKDNITQKRIIKDGSISLRVTQLKEAKDNINKLVKTHNGYYANENLSNTDRVETYYLKIRIPSANFENFIEAIEKGKGEIVFKNIKARDVTDKYIDLKTRLENKRSYLKQYNEILKKAQSIEDILLIRERIRNIEEEIESTTGQLKYLCDQVDFSTLELTITKHNKFKYTPSERDKFTERLKQALSKGWFGLIDFFIFIIGTWPFWIILAGVFYLFRKYGKHRKEKRNNKKQ